MQRKEHASRQLVIEESDTVCHPGAKVVHTKHLGACVIVTYMKTGIRAMEHCRTWRRRTKQWCDRGGFSCTGNHTQGTANHEGACGLQNLAGPGFLAQRSLLTKRRQLKHHDINFRHCMSREEASHRFRVVPLLGS